MDQNIDEIIKMLDGFVKAEVGRIKVAMSDELGVGEMERKYHHGRCDIGSAWERGCAFDVLPRYTTAVFDLDGTLLDTLEDLMDSLNVTMEHFGLPTHTLEETRRAVGNGIYVLVEKSVPQGTDRETIDAAFQFFSAYYVDHCAIKTKPYEGVIELLRQLKKKGFKTAIVSNKNDDAVKLLVEEHFKGLIDASMGVKEGIRKKPAPDAVYEVLNLLHSQKESTLYIGDSEVDKATADNAGLDCASVTWGFRDKEMLRELKPKKLIDNVEQLFEFLTEAIG